MEDQDTLEGKMGHQELGLCNLNNVKKRVLEMLGYPFVIHLLLIYPQFLKNVNIQNASNSNYSVILWFKVTTTVYTCRQTSHFHEPVSFGGQCKEVETGAKLITRRLTVNKRFFLEEQQEVRRRKYCTNYIFTLKQLTQKTNRA
jgi:hypothetical protein